VADHADVSPPPSSAAPPGVAANGTASRRRGSHLTLKREFVIVAGVVGALVAPSLAGSLLSILGTAGLDDVVKLGEAFAQTAPLTITVAYLAMSLRSGPAEGDGWGGYIAAVALFALSVLAILTSISTAVGSAPGPFSRRPSRDRNDPRSQGANSRGTARSRRGPQWSVTAALVVAAMVMGVVLARWIRVYWVPHRERRRTDGHRD
jgi:hypothetical protein